MAKKAESPFVVCTRDKGVFFGYAADTSGDPLTLKRARMCVYWSSDMKGVLGLASKGPSGTCKISDAIPEIELRGITCVMTCMEEAAKKWEENGWKP